MPKLFPINIQVEEVAVGRVMRVLNSLPGVAKINFELMDKKEVYGANGHAEPGAARGPYKQRKPPVRLGETGEELVANALYGGPPLTNAQLRDVFSVQGRSPHSINSVLHAMKLKGEVRLSDEGLYSLTQKVRDRLRHRKAAKAAKKSKK